MKNVVPSERVVQDRVVRRFQSWGYEYLGNWAHRAGNGHVEEAILRDWLRGRDLPAVAIDRAVHDFQKTVGNASLGLYDRNRIVYQQLRYGIPVKTAPGVPSRTIELIDWEHPENNRFAVAEEVTLAGLHARRPDLVVYVNGIALAVIELKSAVHDVAKGIRQLYDLQKPDFAEPFFSTVQLLVAGNDTQGLRYGAIGAKEKYFLEWKEEDPKARGRRSLDRKYLRPGRSESLLDFALARLFAKPRLLDLIHNFIAFDKGVKKIARPNQFFAVHSAQPFIDRREGGIIWNTQGSGKSLIMVWLAKWIREHVSDPRVLIITDRAELDDQIEKVFLGVGEKIVRTKSGADLIRRLNAAEPWLLCSLVHKFGGKEDGKTDGAVRSYLDELTRALPKDFRAKGNLVVFVDECHRTQSGDLHQAMKKLLPNATFLGFTGTPLLKKDKKKSIEVFGPYIHTYKFDEAVKDGVVLDLRYEARDVDQTLSSKQAIDDWFNVHTVGLTDLAKAQLKKRWGQMRTLLSSRSRLQMIVMDICKDMMTRPRLMDETGGGNAILVSGSIYEACKFYELFNTTFLKGKCAIVTSYQPDAKTIKGQDAGEGENESLEQYRVYREMLADWFQEPAEAVIGKVETFETQAKQRFIDEPGRLKLLIVVDKLLTGFDAPSATYLYIDKPLRDHGLFQAICRVNRLDDGKSYGYIVDYKDLFRHLEDAVDDYTGGALDGYAPEDVGGLLTDRLARAREKLDETREQLKALCEPVARPKNEADYRHYFCARTSGDAAELKANEPKRLTLYRFVSAFIVAYADLANELPEAGYGDRDIVELKSESAEFVRIRDLVKMASGDAIDLKRFEPGMRQLIDTYVLANPARSISNFDDLSIVTLIVERGKNFIKDLPPEIASDKEAVAEIIENNVRRVIIDEHPVNPRYYDQLSDLLDALIQKRRQNALDYQEYLRQIIPLARKAKEGPGADGYPETVNSPARRALFDNLGKNGALTLSLDDAIRENLQDGWRDSVVKKKQVRRAIARILHPDHNTDPSEAERILIEQVFALAMEQHDY